MASTPRTDLGVERRLHGEARAQQTQPPQAAPPRLGGADLDDDQQREGRPGGQLVEDDVGRVGRHRREGGPRRREALQRGQEVLDESTRLELLEDVAHHPAPIATGAGRMDAPLTAASGQTPRR
jgi:hypothetical protein